MVLLMKMTAMVLILVLKQEVLIMSKSKSQRFTTLSALQSGFTFFVRLFSLQGFDCRKEGFNILEFAVNRSKTDV